MNTKASVLEKIKNTDKTINILPQLVIMSDDFHKDCDNTIKLVQTTFSQDKLIVRSSCKAEDQADSSNAGKFDSVLNVDRNNNSELKEAIERVIASYQIDSNEEVLIQPMLDNITMSGVVFTADVTTLAPYYIVNYQVSNNTEAVTSGKTSDLESIIIYREVDNDIIEKPINLLIQVCKKIENIMESTTLDIEFAITEERKVYIFQTRPIARNNKNGISSIDISNVLKKISKKVHKLMQPHPYLLGRKTVFGVMPDWNPAEIIGIRPKALASSMYKELVTDYIWAYQRSNYGYRELTSHPLMILFCGIPYIDTRITFNSFIPDSLNKVIAEKLVNYYICQIEKYPVYHDKVEFEIVFSCYYFGISEKLSKLLDEGFNRNEIKRIEYSLLELTNNIIDPKSGLYKQDLERANELDKRLITIMNSDISLVDKIYWLIEDCKKYGTLPFAGVARAAFIAVQFLKSFINLKIITTEEYNKFMNSLNTVNKQLSEDLGKLNEKSISRAEFLDKYGHIRPGTYDICSKRYDENFDMYFSASKVIDKRVEESVERFEFSKIQKEKIELELQQNGLLVTVDELICFIRESIEGREYVKFQFSKSVSMIFKLIECLGTRLDITREDMAYLDINLVKKLYVELDFNNLGEIIKNNIKENREKFRYAQSIKLPSVILKPEDIYYFHLLNDEPNFITVNQTIGQTVTEENIADDSIKGKIVFIKSADPGYDFLFTKKIAGLITQYGGVNSHMAIRCAELGIPAVIGAGEQNFTKWKSYHYVKLDCQKKQVINLDGVY